MTVRVVTDSTADLTPEMAREHGVTVVPLQVRFGETTYRDRVDIAPDDFYARLVQSKVLPTTSQPSVGDFAATYSRLTQETDQVVSIHISSKLSGTLNSALVARQQLTGPCQVEVIDTFQVSWGLGLVVLEAARAAQAGADLAGVAEVARQASRWVHLVAMLDTLEYLHKGGRIGPAQAFLGSLLRIKPVIIVQDGEVHPLERVRTASHARERLVSYVRQFPAPTALAVAYSTTVDLAHGLAQELGRLYPGVPVHTGQIGPAIGTHAGPGALGVAFITQGSP